ncbi:MAG: tetratricopeptide repeat protein [Candidatus Sericytochromatia bacterium]
MDLQVLATLQKKTSGLSQQRHELSHDLTRQAVAELLAAQAEDYARPERLVAACNAFMDAIRHHRQALEPWIGMGYLLWLTGDPAEARLYLSEALLLDPENKDALTLMALAQTAPSEPEPLSDDTQSDAYDQLYDALEARIHQGVQRLSSLRPDTFVLSRERFQIQKMERHYARLMADYQEMQDQMAVIEQEIDCSPLAQMLRPFDILLRRCQEVLTASWQLCDLHDMLAQHNHWLDQEWQRLSRLREGETPEFSQERLDYLLNDCDALADQIDQLEQKEQDVSLLVPAYEALAAKIGQLQDLLDQF